MSAIRQARTGARGWGPGVRVGDAAADGLRLRRHAHPRRGARADRTVAVAAGGSPGPPGLPADALEGVGRAQGRL